MVRGWVQPHRIVGQTCIRGCGVFPESFRPAPYEFEVLAQCACWILRVLAFEKSEPARLRHALEVLRISRPHIDLRGPVRVEIRGPLIPFLAAGFLMASRIAEH